MKDGEGQAAAVRTGETRLYRQKEQPLGKQLCEGKRKRLEERTGNYGKENECKEQKL